MSAPPLPGQKRNVETYEYGMNQGFPKPNYIPGQPIRLIHKTENINLRKGYQGPYQPVIPGGIGGFSASHAQQQKN